MRRFISSLSGFLLLVPAKTGPRFLLRSKRFYWERATDHFEGFHYRRPIFDLCTVLTQDPHLILPEKKIDTLSDDDKIAFHPIPGSSCGDSLTISSASASSSSDGLS